MSTQSKTYLVEGMSCGHCRAAVSEEAAEVDGVEGAGYQVAGER